MNTVQITHNPFIVKTDFMINGQSPATGCKLSSYCETRLQVWVEQLFVELEQLFNGDSNYQIAFKGVESDWLDIKEAAEKYKVSRIEWTPTEPTENRLDKVRELMDEAKKRPELNAYIQSNDEVQKSFEEALNCDFDVYVVATMSSGKSTLINAMLGRDLLPAGNEATTATITGSPTTSPWQAASAPSASTRLGTSWTVTRT